MIILMISLTVSAQEKNAVITRVPINTGDPSCVDAPTDLIRVTVQQISKKEPAYVFLVTNLSEFPIYSLIVGEGKMYDGNRFRGAPGNNPTKMEAPDGWRALFLDGERSYYLWQMEKNADIERMILSGNSSSDFRIYLPEDTRGTYVYTDGVVGSQEKFKDLPFKVHLNKGPCLWGIIKTVDYIE